MTLGAHVVETMRATEFCELARATAGLSWGDPSKREAYVDAQPYRACGDSEAAAQDLAGSLSSCAMTTMRNLQRVGVDGRVSNFRKRASCDPLSEPYQGRSDAPAYLETLAMQRGVLRRPVKGERPDIAEGCVLEIGGDDGLPPEKRIYGGGVHVIQVTGVRADGTLDTIEGGKLDKKNPKPSPKNCTAIEADLREVYQRPDGTWWVRDAGSTGLGRMLRWWFWVGGLPLRGEASRG